MALNAKLALPLQVTSPVDIGRLQRELEAIDATLNQATLRKTTDAKLGKTTALMDATVQLNKLNLLDATQRQGLMTFLALLKNKAPVLHISFSADPATAFVEKLVTWLRREIDPFVLVTVGLQPNIGAGCVIRSTNKYFDLSLRQDFASKRELLLQKLGRPKVAPSEIAGVPSAAAVAAAVPQNPDPTGVAVEPQTTALPPELSAIGATGATGVSQ